MKTNRQPPLKPRNPLVAAARFRRAGAHTRRDSTRQAARERLRREIAQLKQAT